MAKQLLESPTQSSEKMTTIQPFPNKKNKKG